MRLDGAQEVKRQLEAMVHALAHAAEELAAESEQGRLAPVPRAVSVDDDPEPRMRAVPEPEPQPDPDEAASDPANVTELRVPEAEPEAAPQSETETAAAEPVPEEAPEVTEGGTPVAEEQVEVVDAVEVVEGNGAAETAEQPAEQRGFDGDDMLAARLVALQMAVAGSARDEVEAHLRKTFSLDEPGAILNDVFGTESKL
jgi:hypothetical protein